MISVNYANISSFAPPDCPRCGSNRVVHDGRYPRRGKHAHRYKCWRCGYRFVPAKTDLAVKAWAVRLYVETGTTLMRVAAELKTLFEIVVSHTTIRNWVLKTKTIPDEIRCAKGGKWHVDETVIHSNGEKWWIWIVEDRKSRCVPAWHVEQQSQKKERANGF